MMLFGSFAFGQTTISNCGDFADGPNDTWTDALTACTLGDGNDGATQTFTMNKNAYSIYPTWGWRAFWLAVAVLCDSFGSPFVSPFVRPFCESFCESFVGPLWLPPSPPTSLSSYHSQGGLIGIYQYHML